MELKGPWAFSPGLIESTDDPRLQRQTVTLPAFFENRLGRSEAEATVAIRLKTTPNLPLTLDLKEPFSVWKVYIDDQPIASSGIFSNRSDGHKAKLHHKLITFTPSAETTTVLIQIANTQHQHIGFYETPLIAPNDILMKHHVNVQLFETLISALLIIVGIYHIGLFFAWKKDKAPLWFGILCMFVALRMSSTSAMVLLDVFPSLSWELMLRIQYFSGSIALPLFVWYLDSLYPDQIIRAAKYFYISIALFFLILCSFFPVPVFTPFLFPYEFVYLSFIVYTLIVLSRALMVKEAGSFLAFVTFIILSGFLIHDFLRFDNLIDGSADIAPYGFILYLIAQAAILLQRYSHAFQLIEEHTENLENMVSERTAELSRSVAQRELLLRELTHRVKNNLQFIVGLIWIQRKEADQPALQTLKTLESQIQSISTVHETLCTQENVSAVEIGTYITRLVSSLNNLHPEMDITLNSVTLPLYIKPDHAVSLGLILNELITNHFKYSDPENRVPIHIFIEQKGDLSVILHYNDETDHRDNCAQSESSSFGLPKLGWPMIKAFIKQMNGAIIPYHDRLEFHFHSCRLE